MMYASGLKWLLEHLVEKFGTIDKRIECTQIQLQDLEAYKFGHKGWIIDYRISELCNMLDQLYQLRTDLLINTNLTPQRLVDECTNIIRSIDNFTAQPLAMTAGIYKLLIKHDGFARPFDDHDLDQKADDHG